MMPTAPASLLEEALSEQPKHKGARRAPEKLMTNPGLRQRIARTPRAAVPRRRRLGQAGRRVLRVQREALPDAKSRRRRRCSAASPASPKRTCSSQATRSSPTASRALDPADVQSRGNVERIATQPGRFEDLAAAWEEAFLATDEDNLALRGELPQARGRALRQPARRSEPGATPGSGCLIRSDPLDTAAGGRPSRLYNQAAQWSDLIDVLRRQAEWAQGGDRKEILFRVGEIQQNLLAWTASPLSLTYREILRPTAPRAGRSTHWR